MPDTTDNPGPTAQNLWPTLDELVKPEPPRSLRTLLDEQATALGQTTGDLLLGKVHVDHQPNKSRGIRHWQYTFAIQPTVHGPEGASKETVLFLAREPGAGEPPVRYPYEFFYPDRAPYHGAALYQGGLVLLDDGNWAEDDVEQALARVLKSHYVRKIVGDLYRRVQKMLEDAKARDGAEEAVVDPA